MERKFVLIDGNSIASASYFGVPPLSTKKGIPTNAVFGFIKSVFKLMEDFPTHFAVVFDKGKSHRKAASAVYKKNRKPMDDTLRVQYPLIRHFLDLMRIPRISKEGLEGDDILASFVERFHQEIPISIATRDRDLFQLCNYPNTKIIFTRMIGGSSVTQVLDAAGVEQLTGLKPYQIVFYKALAGDPSDNIPGVSGIGDKIAVKLLQEHTNLSTIIISAAEDRLKPVRLNKLINEDLENLYESLHLATLRIERVHKDLDFFVRKPGDEEGLNKFYKELEFKSLLGE